MKQYTKNIPLEIRAEGRRLSAWPDRSAKGGIVVKIDCQSHPIQVWRDEGLALISSLIYTEDAPLSSRDILGLMFGDPKKAFDAIVAHIAKIKKANPQKIADIQQLYQQLLVYLDLVEKLMKPVIEATRKTAKSAAGTKPKKNGKPTGKTQMPVVG